MFDYYNSCIQAHTLTHSRTHTRNRSSSLGAHSLALEQLQREAQLLDCRRHVFEL